MRYISTRGKAPVLNFEEVVLTGLARDGGLYLPESWPQFSEDDIRKIRGSVFKDIPEGDEFVRAWAEFRGLQMNTGVRFDPGETAARTTVAAAEKTLAREEAAKTTGNWINNLLSGKHKGVKAAIALGAGAAAIALAGSKVRDVLHNASQDEVRPRSPRTEYVASPLDELGHQLRMGGVGPPESLTFARGLMNQVQPGTDVRVIDSRMSVSDRVFGYMADDRMGSIYSSSPF